MGTCNGPVKTGDRNNNGLQDQPDAQTYVNEILGDDAVVSSCTDLNADGEITVTDAALLANCYNRQTQHDGQTHLIHYHPWCDFPRGYVSSIDTVDLQVGALDPVNRTVDILVRNNTCRVMGFEFDMAGLTISSVENLNPQVQGEMVWSNSTFGTKVIGISYIDSSLAKNTGFAPLCRIHYQSLTAGTVCIAGIPDIVNKDANNVTARIVGPCATVNNVVALDLKLMLEGPFDGVNRMRDDLRAAALIPTTEPYTALGYLQSGGGGEQALPQVFTTTGDNAMVDWVLVELRNAAAPTQVVASRCALVQRDGDVVGPAGSGSVLFDAPAGNYYVAVRHRNHLGVMTASPMTLGSSASVLDLRAPATATWGVEARKNVNGTMVLWTGNVFHDGTVAQLKYVGQNNDRDPILTAIGGTMPTAVISGYMREDINLTGTVKYTGLDNDRDPILVNIGSTVPTNVRFEQLP